MEEEGKRFVVNHTVVSFRDRFLGIKEVSLMLGISQQQVRRLVTNGDLPKARSICERRAGWLESTLIIWMYSRPVKEMRG